MARMLKVQGTLLCSCYTIRGQRTLHQLQAQTSCAYPFSPCWYDSTPRTYIPASSAHIQTLSFNKERAVSRCETGNTTFSCLWIEEIKYLSIMNKDGKGEVTCLR